MNTTADVLNMSRMHGVHMSMTRLWQDKTKKKQSGGFLSTILGLGIIGGGIWVGTNFGLAGLIVAGIIVFVGIPILIGFLMHK